MLERIREIPGDGGFPEEKVPKCSTSQCRTGQWWSPTDIGTKENRSGIFGQITELLFLQSGNR